jgi:hypothetical protein
VVLVDSIVGIAFTPSLGYCKNNNIMVDPGFSEDEVVSVEMQVIPLWIEGLFQIGLTMTHWRWKELTTTLWLTDWENDLSLGSGLDHRFIPVTLRD